MRLPAPPLLVITDRRQARRPLEDVAASCFAGGCRWLSLREKDFSPAERLAVLRRLVEIGRRHDALVGVHEDVAAAIEAGAGAVHLPDGASPAAARARLGDGVLIGLSAHDAGGIARAAGEGADYVTVSPVFASASKTRQDFVLGLDNFRRLARAASLPVLALSGIDETTLADAVGAGAAGVAVMGEAMRAADPAPAVAALIASLGAALAGR